MYKAIIFDFFDVVHSDPLLAWLRAHDLRVEGVIDEVRTDLDSGRINKEEFFRRLAPVTGQTAAEVAAEMLASEQLNDPLVALIAQLKQHYQLAVVSNAESAYIRGLIARHDLEPLFQEIVVSSEVSMVKPHPAIFEHILEKLKLPAEETIFIDDNPANTAAAEKLGIHGVVYTDLPTLRRDLAALHITLPPAP